VSVSIAVLVKASLDPNMIRARSDGGVDTAATPLAISEYDKNAVEAAVRLRERLGGRVVAVSALTWGPSARRRRELEQVIREALAMGVDEAHVIIDEALIPGDPLLTARAVTALLQKLGGFDLVVTGEASMDMISGQIGGRVAALMGLPFISYARSLEVDPGAGLVRAVRDLEEGLQAVKARLPAVVSVTGEANKPRIPTLLQIRRAMRKPVKTYSLADLGVDGVAKPRLVEMRLIQVKRKNVMIEAETLEQAAEKLIEYLEQEGVLPK